MRSVDCRVVSAGLLSGCYQPSPQPVLQERIVFEIGSGTGIRTLNLAVNRSLPPVRKRGSEFVPCRRMPQISPFTTGVAVRRPPWYRVAANGLTIGISSTRREAQALAALPPCRALGEERFDPLPEVVAHVGLYQQVRTPVPRRHLHADAAERLLSRLQR